VVPSILIVDDDEAQRYTLRLLLEAAGFEVREAASGIDGLHAANAKPNLVMLDVNLPDLGGFDVCRRLKTAPATATIPVLCITTSYPGVSERMEAFAAGAAGYITRPMDPAMLVSTVRTLLRTAAA
jgi:DNA-binding response OmpR family regulator